MWGIIQNPEINTKYSDLTKWFVPSKSEWAAFGDMLWTKFEVTTDTYTDYNLEYGYWSSSQSSYATANNARFVNGYIDYANGDMDFNYYVRLSATF